MEFLGLSVETVNIATLAIVILLLILVVIILFRVFKEGFVGTGFANKSATGVSGALTGGATMRRLSTDFSQPGQGDHNTVYIDEIKEAVPGVFKESLVSDRSPPVFWETGSILDEYRRGEGAYATPGESPYSEGMNPHAPVSLSEDDRLAALLAA